ncbi:MAG: NAD-dependent protein deacetylase of SIR2 family [Candidatus Ozemobacter sibiricus]|uniref:NAD-dependent protein deacylase n=1 Tax=Candidatus Ozemobacter sibiricus TaxID=2268124 RepID=A0A367ZTB4_9BACT|nr:MAG: NAD-dependent protein deacetylase of SIR2 family [Candidatus Ozemobacter sibiricus]
MASGAYCRPGEAIVILTGAGISRESGLATFRDADGIWKKVRLEDVATPEGFARDPDRVHEFYNQRRRELQSPHIRPNAAHLALAELDQRWPGDFLLVTQNIDDLHERAGSRRLVHMHGELLKATCQSCQAVFPWTTDLQRATPCPSCARTGYLRPHIVWFGECPFHLDEIGDALARCRLFVSIGTSGNVYPAAGFVEVARRQARARTVELNLEPSQGASRFDEAVYGPATEVVPAFCRSLLASLEAGH